MHTRIPNSSFYFTPAALLLAATLIYWGGAEAALAQTDDFNDGNDNGWTHYQPLSPFGAPGTFSFPSGGYRIQAAASPNPASLGPGRAAGLRTDINYTDFHMVFDVVNWNTGLNQSFGGLARLQQLGLGTTDGYFLTYNTSGSFTIGRILNEGATALGSLALTLNPADDYRIIFDGVGSTLSGRIYDMSDLSTPVGSVGATDASFANGFNGLLAFDNSPTGTGTADVTFDNYFVTVPEPSTTAFVVLGAAALLYAGFSRRK